MAIEEYGSDKRRYSIEVSHGGYMYIREADIYVGDGRPITSACRVVEKVLRRLACRSIDREEIIVKIVKNRE